MAECPVCGSRLYTRNKGIPFINSRKIFGCDACNWQMNVDEVHKRGGLDRIALDIASGNPEGFNKNNSKINQKEWEEIERLPDWAFEKMKRKKTNKINGEHYIYKKEGNKFYKKIK